MKRTRHFGYRAALAIAVLFFPFFKADAQVHSGSIGILMQAGQYIGPLGMSRDASGNMYVANGYRVLKFDASGSVVAEFGSSGTGDGQFTYARDVAIDASGNIFVSDDQRIQKFNSSGVFVTKWGSNGSADGQFNNPISIATDGSGNVYVADADNNRVQKFSNNGTFITKWGTSGTGNGQFQGVTGITVDGSGNVYTLELGGARVQKFSSTGTYITQWGSSGTGDGQFSIPWQIEVNPAGTQVYVTDNINYRIQSFTNTGTFSTKWGTNGYGNGQFDGWINGIGIDASGNVYTSENARIQKFSSGGTFQALWSNIPSLNSQFVGAAKAALDANGNIYVADGSNHRVQKFDRNGNFVMKFGSRGISDGFLNYPYGVAVDASGNIYVSDANNRIQKFDNAGNFILKWGTSGSGDGQFIYVPDLAVDASGNILIADATNNRIQKFTNTGTFISKFGSPGSADGQLSNPQGIGLDAAGNIYVTDVNNYRIQKFDNAGNFITKWGSQGSGDGQFSYPRDIAFDASGAAYVVDANNSLIQKFDGSGNFLGKWGMFGYDVGQFANASGIAISQEGTLYVADDREIEKFSLPPAITSFSPASGPAGTSVTITGTYFSATAAENVVYFGAARATVTSASATQLVVTVPAGATYDPISVLKNGAVGYSFKPFQVTFPFGGPLSFSFANHVDFGVGSNNGVKKVAIADLDGDGKLDVAAADDGSDFIRVFRNTHTSGTFSNASLTAALSLATGNGPYNVAAADMDGDGKLDLAASSLDGVAVFLNQSTSGSISFFPQGSFGGSTGYVTFHDLDGDGRPELIASNGGQFTIQRNTSSPGFIYFESPAYFDTDLTACCGYGLAAGDIDGDGKPDLAVSDLAGKVRLFRNTSTFGTIDNNSFQYSADLAVTSFNSTTDLADIDNDGKLDVVAASNGLISVFRNTSTSGVINSGSFSAPVTFTGAGTWTSAVGELDGDGKPEILFTNIDDGKVTILKNESTPGSLSATSFSQVQITTGGRPVGFAVGDMNGDGRNDLVVGNEGTFMVNVFINNIDTTPPVIGSFSPGLLTAGTDKALAVPFTDSESGIASVNISYRSVTAGGSFTTAAMTRPSTDWTFSIPSGVFSDIGVEFKFTATNGAGLSTTTPLYSLAVSRDAGFSIPYSSFGSNVSNYRIVSVPLDLTSKTINDVFVDDLGAYNIKKWRMYRYSNGTTSELSPSSSIDAGKGYWLIVKDNPGKDITSGPGKTVSTNSDAPFSIALENGFTQIGNPYNFNLLWSDVQAANPSLGLGALRVYTGDFVNGDLLKKMEGGFVFSTSGGTLVFPVVKNPAAGGRQLPESKGGRNALDSEDWQVDLIVKQGTLTNLISGVGMARDASDEYDVQDGITLPRCFDEYLELNHKKTVNGYAYSKDVIPPAENHTWEFTLATSLPDEVITLSWDNTYFGDNDRQLFLWDECNQRAIDMRAVASYTVNKSSAGSFKVVFGSAAYVKSETRVSQLVFHGISPNPTDGHAVISFSLPEKSQGRVTLNALDLMGRNIWRLEGEFAPGYHEVVWQRDGREAAGMYLIEVKSGSQTQLKRLIIR